MEIGPGTRIGDLEVEREIGRGGFGAVYLAQDVLIGRWVALKVVQSAGAALDQTESDRVLTEIRAMGQISSPHIVTLYRVHPPTPDGAWMFEMEYVDGGTLQDILEPGDRIEADRVIEIARDLARALEAAHRSDIVHGDVKPSNVLLGPDGRAKLADFGLARIVGDVSLSMSQVPGLAGTPFCMAPEVVMGRPPNTLSDIWSFGIVLYRALAGDQPFPADNLNALFFAIQQRDPAPLPADVPVPLAQLVLRCLEKRPERRPGSCTEFLRELESPSAVVPAERPPTDTRGRRLIGREKERAQLEALVVDAIAGRGHTVLLTGDIGLGKSELADRICEYAAAGGLTRLAVSVTKLRGVLRPLLESVRTLLAEKRIKPDDSAIFGSARDVAERLLTTEESIRLESRAQTLWAVEQLLKGVAARQKVCVLVEDAHRADEEDHRILRHLARVLPEAGVLLILTARSGATRDLAALPAITAVALEPLDRDETFRLLQDRTQVGHVAPVVARKVFAVAHGNPLFTVELLRHLEGSGAVVRDDAGLLPGPNWERRGIPSKLQELVSRRVAALPESDRELLDAAAVDGVRFDGEALAAIMGEPLLRVLRNLQRILRQHGLVKTSADGYRFANSLFRDVLYADLAPEFRRAVHLQLARHLETRTHIDPERLGLHWERGGEPARAETYLLEATQRAALRQEYLRAIDCARRAGIDVDDLDLARFLPEHDETLIRLAFCYQATGRGDAAQTLLEGVVAAAANEDSKLRARVRLANIRYRKHGPAGVDIDGLKHAAESLPPCLELGRARYLLGVIAKYRSDLAEAEARFRSADDVYVELDLGAQHAAALDQLASVALRRGHTDEAQRLYGEAAAVAHKIGRGVNGAISDVNRAMAAFAGGHDIDLVGILEPSVRTLTLEGAINHAGHATSLLAAAHYALGDRAAAEKTVDEALALLAGRDYWVSHADAALERAHLVAIRGDLADARRSLEEARALARRGDDHEKLAGTAMLECHLELWSGDREAADRVANDCLDLLAAHPGTQAQAEAALWLAEAALYGLPPATLARAAELTAADWVGAVVAAARAFADPRALAEPLREAARILESPPTGPRRALHRVLAAVFDAEAGRRDDGTPAPQVALERARALEHKWLTELIDRRYA